MLNDLINDNDENPPPQPRTIFAWTAFIGLVTAFIFVGFPQIDIWAGSFFVYGKQAFFLNYSDTGKAIREIFKLAFLILSICALAGLILSIFTNNRLLGLTFPKWLFLTLSLLIGPGLITNVILKDEWGRARPFYIKEFGGPLKFTPALIRSDQCKKNCSFVSGEASSIYTAFFALALIAFKRRKRLLTLGVIFGTLAGIVRMGQGGHFLSDVIFAGVFMMLTVLAINWLISRRYAHALAEGGHLHRKLIAYATSIKTLSTSLKGYAQNKFGTLNIFRHKKNNKEHKEE